jgi:hypothetical protein
MKKTTMQTIVFLASFVLVLTLVGSVATGGIVFLDDFEDGSATDGAPVTWTPWPGATGSFEVIDGDFVMTRPSNIEEMYCYVDKYMTQADTSIRTQARLIGSTAWWLGLLARGNTAPTMYALLLFNNGRLEIWRFGPTPGTSWILAGAGVGIDPRAQDVLLRFDVIGNELSAWAWREGDPMPAEPQVTAVHSELATGGVGIAADLGWRLSNNQAIFRYVEVYDPIPPTRDFNGDGIVDFKDFSKLAQYWRQNERSVDIAPPIGNGIVDVQDVAVLAEYWLQEVDLFAHWTLDETAGTIAHDSAGNNDGTLQNSPTWQPTNGKLSGALQFDGIDDYISTPFVLNPADAPFSVFVWVKGSVSGQVILSQAGSANWLSADPSEGKLMTDLAAPAGRFPPQPLASQCVITDGDWHRIGFTWDGSNRILYVDDVEVARDTQSTLEGSDGGLYIGAGKDREPDSFFSGLIDDVKILSAALRTGSTIAQ